MATRPANSDREIRTESRQGTSDGISAYSPSLPSSFWRKTATSRKAFKRRSRFPGALFTKSGLGCGVLRIFIFGLYSEMILSACSALRPTSTIILSRGSKSRSRVSEEEPEVRSKLLAGRILDSLPIYHGTIFHTTDRLRGIPACAVNSKKFFAVSSGLLREIKPERIALAPGASSKNRTSAVTPPSHGSKSGMDALSPTSPRSDVTKSLKGLT